MLKKLTFGSITFLFYILGCCAVAAGTAMFLAPNGISPGGFTGIATALNRLWGLPSGITLFAINIPVLTLGFLKLGGLFVLKTALVTFVFSCTLELFDKFAPSIITDSIIAAIFGGILLGVGISLIMLKGATTGGVDIIAKLINRRYPHITVGRVVLLFDAAVALFAAFVYGNIESALYSVVAMYTSARLMDSLLYGADKGKIIYIISESSEQICRALTTDLERGVTKLKASGGYTNKDRTVLMCTVRRHEVSSVYKIISEHDKSAFIVVGEAGEIIGEGFKAIKD